MSHLIIIFVSRHITLTWNLKWSSMHPVWKPFFIRCQEMVMENVGGCHGYIKRKGYGVAESSSLSILPRRQLPGNLEQLLLWFLVTLLTDTCKHTVPVSRYKYTKYIQSIFFHIMKCAFKNKGHWQRAGVILIRFTSRAGSCVLLQAHMDRNMGHGQQQTDRLNGSLIWHASEM